jgi:hypothetical protein
MGATITEAMQNGNFHGYDYVVKYIVGSAAYKQHTVYRQPVKIMA